MTELAQFAVLGLGIGSIFALLALGLIVIYRGSGTINLAHGHMAILGAFLMIELHDDRGLPIVLAVPAVTVLVGVCGALVHVLVMRPLSGASPLSRVIASLGILTIIHQVIALRYGAAPFRTDPVLPRDPISFGSVTFGAQNLYLLGIACAVTLMLTVVSSRSRVGLAVSAAAENPRAAGALGWSPELLAVATWSLGGALAGLAGTLVSSTRGGYISLSGLSLLIVGTLAASLFAQFRSYPVALIGALVIAITQSEVTEYVHFTGAADAVPFAFIVLLVVVRGRGLPVRGSTADALPSVGQGRIRPLLVIGVTAAAILLVQISWELEYDYLQAVVISTTLAIVALSIVVLAGYAGQLSLAQMGLAGIGAWIAGRLVASQGWSFGPALIVGVLGAAVAGLAFGLPALRTRGVNLTVVTFGLGFAVYAVVFSNTDLTGGIDQTRIPAQKLWGVEIDPLLHLHNYASVCIIALALTGGVVANLRRGRAGRRLLAVRVNERAAASIGVSVFGAKLYAFALAAAIAGLGGVLLAFSYSTILYGDLFGPLSSVSVLTIAVIGGVGWVLGPTIGSLLAAGGLGVVLAGGLSDGSGKYAELIGGVVLVVLLIVSQNGVAAALVRLVPRRLREWRVRPVAGGGVSLENEPVPALSLVVEGLTQRFGGVTALEDVSVVVEPGTVLGLLGPNGAGKTTLIDAVTGYARPATGRVLLGGVDITQWSPTKRARHGLTRSFQSLELFDDLTVRENLLAASDRRDAWAYLTDLVWPGRVVLSAPARAAVEILELDHLLDRTPREISFGERRLVAIARAVAARPSVLLLDEPGAGLDESETAELGDLVRRLAQTWNMAVLLIEHDVAMVLRTSDSVQVLDFGRTIYSGAPGGVTDDPRVRAAYLGEPAHA